MEIVMSIVGLGLIVFFSYEAYLATKDSTTNKHH
jgi:hypothetical protein